MRVTQETKAVAQQALDYILRHPANHSQNNWFWYPGIMLDSRSYYYTFYDGTQADLCDTTMCVAGTVQWQQDGIVDTATVSEFAAYRLGLDEEEASILFYDVDDETAVTLLTAIAKGDVAKFKEIQDNFSSQDIT